MNKRREIEKLYQEIKRYNDEIDRLEELKEKLYRRIDELNEE
jgi:transcription elongation factor Elf1